MKSIFRIFILSIMTVVLATSCGDEPFDAADGGQFGANLYVTSEVKYFTGDLAFDIDLDKYENEGITISSINYTVQLNSTLGVSDISSLSVAGTTTSLSVTISELLKTLPVGGNILQESDLEPGDTFSFEFTITLADGRELDPPASTLVTVLCAPAPGDYVIVMHDSFGDGWQTNDNSGGNGLQVTLNDGTVFEVGMCSPYLASGFDCIDGDGYNAEDVITIPDSAESADWYFPGDAYGEISFEIYSPSGDKLFEYLEGEQYAGTLPIINCSR